MAQIRPQIEQPRLTVYLPPEMEKEVYEDFRVLAQHAITEATKNVTVNDRYLNQKELCQYFKCGIAQIKEWEKLGLRHFLKGREKMYSLNIIHEFIESQMI